MKHMELLNLKVKHATFGEGIVISVSDNRLTIQFASKIANFVYPDSFEKFLIAEDAFVQSEIAEEIKRRKRAAEEVRQAELIARKTEEERRTIEKQPAPDRKKPRTIEDGFGPDYHVKYLAKQPVFTYQQVEAQFGIKIAGFGRGINNTLSSVILISSIDRKKFGFVYHDHWTDDGDYIYSGEGKIGNQTMTLGNQSIVNAARNGKPIHLFVKFSPQEYYYQGIFSLVDYDYEEDIDESGSLRKEYKFRLRKQFVKE